ncbi:helix-turn-helix transcriptional regulator [Heyndrickxia oleronia]|uniref:Helix-turn-helix transcriptional regulator n=1 Tax=Heyndrickxia oleronia TaxID=38875 RepID=A0AAW6T2C6_9BACI|nr:helix-turn-helix transcriptional regulator [Heyndrickxia oleronia]
MHIGKRIKYLRQKNNLTLELLGKGIVSSTHLSNLESGRFTPSKDILKMLSEKLGEEEDYLLLLDEYDENLAESIEKLEVSILYNLSETKEIISKIERRKYIFHIQQEVQFYLLKACYLLKNRIYVELEEYEILINIFIDDDDLPQNIKKLYFYYLGLKFYIRNELENSYNFFLKLIDLSSNNNFIAPYKYNLALICKKKFNYPMSISFAKEALEIYLDNQMWDKVGSTYNFIGVTYWEQNNFEKAMKYLEKAEKVQDLINSKKLKASVFHNLGLVYKSQNEYEHAISCFSKSIDIKKGINNNPIISFRALIDLYLITNRTDLAMKELESARQLANNKIDFYLLQTIYSDIIEQNGDLDTSITLLSECINFFEKEMDKYHLKNLYNTLGDRYYSKKKYKLAAINYKKELNLMEMS